MTLTPVDFSKARGHAPRLSPQYVPGKVHGRYWTEEENEILRRTYPTAGPAACAVLLPRRTIHQVHAHAHSMGLYAPKGGPTQKRKHLATPELDDRIKAGWPSLTGKGAVMKFAEQLSQELGREVPRWWVSKRALALGLAMPHSKEPPWSKAEEALLREIPLHNLPKASRLFREHGFHRTPASIGVYAKRIGVSRRYSETLSANQIGKILGIDPKSIVKWVLSGHLKAERRETERLPQQGGDPWSITRPELRRFIIDNLGNIDIRKVDKFEFVAILIGES